MKRFIIAVFIFLCTLTGASISSAGMNTINAPAAMQTSYVYEEDFIYVRVLIDGHWWTYVYTSDGSFIVAIPDEDE